MDYFFVHSMFTSILKKKRKLVALLLLSHRCIVIINVMWLFLTVPLVSLHCVIVVFPYHTHLHFYQYFKVCWRQRLFLLPLYGLPQTVLNSAEKLSHTVLLYSSNGQM